MDPEARKKVLRLFSYGMAVVGAAHGGKANVFTANWYSQCSFDPPLIMLSVERDSQTLGLIRVSGQFALSLLPSGARAIAADLGRSSYKVPDKIAKAAWHPGNNGAPILDIAVGSIELNVLSEHPAGDSVVLIAEVVDAHLGVDAPPLTMAEAGFRHAG